MKFSIQKLIKPLVILSSAAIFIWTIADDKLLINQKSKSLKTSYIISAPNFKKLQTTIAEMQLKPTHNLNIINAIAVNLTPSELAQLQNQIKVTATPNHQVKLAGWNNGYGKGKRRWQPSSVVADYIGAATQHDSKNFGGGVTIGFLDTGLDQLVGLGNDLYGRDKAWGTYDAVTDTVSNYDDEASGHGTHVASIAGNSDYDVNGKIYGVAPNALLVGIKAFDANGQATYADVIRGIEWALQIKDQINLRVLNMSFSGPVSSYYWEDPLNQAVMKAWQAGIVVVASAGNKGPEPMTIGVPGNVPYIITVGAMTDNYSTDINNDDKLATFSSAGPTYEAFVKPEILAPGGHLSGLMSLDSQIVTEHPEFSDGGRYFEMSGTSQAAAVVSGAVALMLTDNPNLTPDQVKCRLIASAHPALKDDGSLAYSVFQQGAGVINVNDAINSSASDCANQGLNIANDLAGIEHFAGPANIDDNGNFYIDGLGQEYVWNISESVDPTQGYTWHNDLAIDHFVWRTALDIDHFVWRTNFEVNHFVWRTSADFTNTDSIGINNWVAPQ